MKTVCIDNHILVWGVRKVATPGQESMIERAEQFIAWLNKMKTRVLVPAPVLHEFLCGCDTPTQNVMRGIIEQDFLVVPFDTAAAVCATQIWRDNHVNGVVNAAKSDHADLTRARIRIDHQIAGIAMARRVDALFTEDRPLYRFAEGHLTVKSMPEDIGKQLAIQEFE